MTHAPLLVKEERMHVRGPWFLRCRDTYIAHPHATVFPPSSPLSPGPAPSTILRHTQLHTHVRRSSTISKQATIPIFTASYAPSDTTANLLPAMTDRRRPDILPTTRSGGGAAVDPASRRYSSSMSTEGSLQQIFKRNCRALVNDPNFRKTVAASLLGCAAGVTILLHLRSDPVSSTRHRIPLDGIDKGTFMNFMDKMHDSPNAALHQTDAGLTFEIKTKGMGKDAGGRELGTAQSRQSSQGFRTGRGRVE